MRVKLKMKKVLAMLLAVVLSLSGMIPQFVFPVLAEENAGPVYVGENLTISETADIVNLSDTYLSKLKDLSAGTISLRYRTTADQGLSAMFALSSTVAGQDNSYAVAYINPANNTVGVEVRDQAGGDFNKTSATGAGIADNEWHSVTYVFGDTNFQIYLDGKKVKDQAVTGFFDKITSPTSVKVGALDRAARGQNQWPFKGDIDKIEVYDRVLPEEEILAFQEATTYEPTIPDDPADAERTDTKLFYGGYEGSVAYRIPSLLTTMDGTVIAAIDKRQSGSGDQGNIDTVIKRSLDGGASWEPTQTLINLPGGSQKFSFTIDSTMVQDKNSGEIFLIVDMFPESSAIMDTSLLQAGTGYKEIDGKKYFILRNYENSNSASNPYTEEYTIREEGVVWDESTNTPTNYVVPDFSDGTLYEKTTQAADQPDETSDDVDVADRSVTAAEDMTPCGNIFLYTGSNAGKLKAIRTSYLWMVSSKDDGVTWSKPRDLTFMVKKDWMLFSGTGPGVGIQTESGRLVVPVYATNSNVGVSQSSAVIYSDDGGETWAMGETVNDGVVNGGTEHMTGGNMLTESQVVEVKTKDRGNALKLFCRNSGTGNVLIATSYDGGATWEDTFQKDETLREPYCQLSIVPYPYPVEGYEGKQMFLFANPNAGSRVNGTLRLGYYDPETDAFVWIASRVVDSGAYGYSCVTAIADGKMGLFWEGTNLDLNLSTFNFAWLFADKTPQPRQNPTVTGISRAGDQIAVTFDQPVIVMGAPSLAAVQDGNDNVSMPYASGSGSRTIYFTNPNGNGHTLSFTGITAESGDFYGNNENKPVTDDSFGAFRLDAEQEAEISNLTVTPGYSSVKLNFDAFEGADSYIVMRSSSKDSGFSQIGTTAENSYVDKTGVGQKYYYKVSTADGAHVSAVIGNTLETGFEAMQKSAVIYENLMDTTFDGQTLVDISDKAEALKLLNQGSVIVKFKPAKTGNQVLIMGKEKGGTTAATGSTSKADILLEGTNPLMVRADLAHVRANNGKDFSLDVDQWHTAIFSTSADAGDPGAKVLRFTIDGEERGSTFLTSRYPQYAGFFSKVPVLTEVTLGGYYNGDTTTVSNGFQGQIAYIAVTDEIMSDDEAKAFTETKVPVLDSVVPGYASIKVNYTAVEGTTSYDIYRSTSAEGPFVKIGSSSTGTYTDKTGSGMTYYYQVRNSDQTQVSGSMSNQKPTGIEAMKENAVLFKDVKDVKFDGSTLVDVSDKAAEVAPLDKGSVIFRFRTTDSTQSQAVLLGKTAKGQTNIIGGGQNKASFLLAKVGEQMRVRADMVHTRAEIQSDFADGEWHTAAIMNDVTAENAFRFTIDGKELANFNSGNNNSNVGFFSTVSNLNQLTIGGYYNGDTTTVSNGFVGDIDYVMVTDEVLSTKEAGDVTNIENGVVCDITSQMFDQSKDNTWVFSGGAVVEGGFDQTQGIRNFIGQFEEYIRWTKSGSLMGRQRYTINTGKSGNTLADVNNGFDTLVGKYDPRALSVFVGEEDYQAGQAGIEAFKETLAALTEKAMGLRGGNGYLVIQTPFARKDAGKNELAQAYAAAVGEFYDALSMDQKTKVLVVDHFKLTDNDAFKNDCVGTDGKLNAKGHLEIAREFSKAVYGSVDNFPVSDANLNLTPVRTPSEYPDAAPQVTAESGKLTIGIPSEVQGMASAWKFALDMGNVTISGDFSGNTAVVENLTADADYRLTVTSSDGNVRLIQVSGKTTTGAEAQNVPARPTGFTELQQQIQDIVNSDQPATWLFVGDSITHGALHTKGYDSIHQTFEKYVREELGRKDDVVINTAVSGATTAEQEANSNERLDKYDADVVVVMLGTNDASNAIVPLDQYRTNLESIVDKIHAKGAVAVLRTPNPLRSGDSRATNLPKYAEVIRETAQSKGAILVDHYADWTEELTTRAYLWQNGYWNNDAIHPNPNGQLNMAQALIRDLGLSDETSPIYNLSYKIDTAEETSTIAAGAVGSGGQIAVDLKALAGKYGSSLGEVTLEAVLGGVTYSTKAKGSDETIILSQLPIDNTYKVTVRAGLLNSSKNVTFASEDVELKDDSVVIGLGFTPVKLTGLKPGSLAGTFSVGALAPEGTREYTLVTGEGSTDNSKFKIDGDRLLVGEELTEGETYSVRVKVTIGENSEEKDFKVKAVGRDLIVDEKDLTIKDAPIDFTDKYLEPMKAMDEGTLIANFVASGSGIQSIFSISAQENSTNAKNTHFHIYAYGDMLGFELRNALDSPTFNYNTSKVSGVLRVGEENRVAFKADRASNSYKLFANGELVLEVDADSLGGFKFLNDIPSLNCVTAGATIRGGVAYAFKGTIGKLQMYGTALSDEELKEVTKIEGYTVNRPFDSQDETGSNYFRIPTLITTGQGNLISAIDARFGGTQDSPNNIDTAVKTSSDNGETWENASLPFHFDDFVDTRYKISGRIQINESASYIDPALLEDQTNGRIFLLVDAFPSGIGSVASQKGSGYTQIDGKMYLKLKKQGEDTYDYTVREGNVIYDGAGNPTEYSLNENFEVLLNGEPLTVKQKDVTYDGSSFTTVVTDNDVKMNVMYNTSLFQVLPTSYLRLKYSDDQGKTWSDAMDLNGMVKSEEMGFLGVGPGRGLQITTGEHKGRLLFQVYELVGSDQFCHTIYSDDHGATWHMGQTPDFDRAAVGCMSESQLIELPDGTLQVFARTTKSRIATAYSKDGGETWTEGKLVEDLTLASGSGCQLSVINYEGYIDGKRAVILTSPTEASRTRGTLRIGLIDDEIQPGEEFYGIDWKYSHEITPSGSYFAYSCLTELPTGDIGLIYEKGNTAQFIDSIYYEKLSVSEVTGDKYDLFVTAKPENALMGDARVEKEGDVYTVRAIPNDGYEFEAWLLNGESIDAAAPEYQFKTGGFFRALFSDMPVYGDKTLNFTARFREAEPVEKFTVTFLGKDGVELKSEVVEKGKNATAPEAPEVEGFTFQGWDKEFTNVQSDLTVNAVYEENQVPVEVYTVTFLGKDGVELKSEEVEKGKSATAPEAPEVEGFVFKGWDTDFSNVQTDLTVHAIYEEADHPQVYYTVTFLGKDGVLLKNQTVKAGEDATAPEAPVVDGFTFKGWDKEFTNIQNDLTVNAIYEENEIPVEKFTVVFLGKDGEELKREEVEKGKAATAPKAPEVEGFVFKGWDADFSDVQADLTINAIYEEAEVPQTYFTVTFLGMDGAVLKIQAVKAGEDASAPKAPDVAGYTFKGWDKAFTNIQGDLVINAVYEKAAPSVDKKVLEELITKAEKLTEKDYTAKSWKVFADALLEAKTVLANKDAAQTEVNKAKDGLQKAVDGLQKRSVKPTPTPGTNPKTGDQAPILPLMVSILAALGIVLVLIRKKRRFNEF